MLPFLFLFLLLSGVIKSNLVTLHIDDLNKTVYILYPIWVSTLYILPCLLVHLGVYFKQLGLTPAGLLSHSQHSNLVPKYTTLNFILPQRKGKPINNLGNLGNGRCPKGQCPKIKKKFLIKILSVENQHLE